MLEPVNATCASASSSSSPAILRQMRVTQLRERRRIEKLLSKFTALAAKLLRIPSHEVGIHQCVDLMVRRSQGNESADRFYGIDSLHMEMVDYTSPRVKTESGSNPQF